MLCSPEALLQKNKALTDTWQRYLATPNFESFVELAISINSFTEFLIDKGIASLHHASHQLEQVTLALFTQDVVHPLPQVAQDDLNERVNALARLTLARARSSLDTLPRDPVFIAPQSMRSVHAWLIGHHPAAWTDLLMQLGYFGMTTEFRTWDQPVADNTDAAAPLLLLDMSGLPEAEWHERIQALRQRFAMGQLICLEVASDFEQLQQALRSGCDSCLLKGLPTHAIVEHIMELNERHDQEAYRVLIV
ncbi:MAG: diguanylate cyclase response regulator, partial [Thiobacillus sp.]|nr:diguanylate cyclase response regulator [Thiobacillus sp.]